MSYWEREVMGLSHKRSRGGLGRYVMELGSVMLSACVLYKPRAKTRCSAGILHLHLQAEQTQAGGLCAADRTGPSHGAWRSGHKEADDGWTHVHPCGSTVVQAAN